MRGFKSKSPKSQTHALYVLSSHPEIHPLCWALRAENQLPAVCTGNGCSLLHLWPPDSSNFQVTFF